MLRNLIQIILLVGKSSEQTARIRSVRIFQFAVHGIQTAKKDRGGKDEIVEIGWSKSVSSRKVGGMPEVGMAKVSNRGARYFKVSCRGRGRKTKTKKVARELVHRGTTQLFSLTRKLIVCDFLSRASFSGQRKETYFYPLFARQAWNKTRNRVKSREIRAGEMTKSRVPRETISVLLSGFSSGASLSKRTCKNKRFLCKSLTFLFFLSLFFLPPREDLTRKERNARGTSKRF